MKKVEIYTSHVCGFCARAKRLLSQKNVQFTETNVLINPAKKSEMLKRSNGSRTVPQIFIGGKHVGGCDELFDLEHRGKLDAMLAA